PEHQRRRALHVNRSLAADGGGHVGLCRSGHLAHQAQVRAAVLVRLAADELAEPGITHGLLTARPVIFARDLAGLVLRIGLGRQTLQESRIFTRGRRHGSRILAAASRCGQNALAVALAAGVLTLAAVRVAFVERVALLVVLATRVANAGVAALAVPAVVVLRTLDALPVGAERRCDSALGVYFARPVRDAAFVVAAQRAKVRTIQIGTDWIGRIVVRIEAVAGTARLHAVRRGRRVVRAIGIGRARGPRVRAGAGRLAQILAISCGRAGDTTQIAAGARAVRGRRFTDAALATAARVAGTDRSGAARESLRTRG